MECKGGGSYSSVRISNLVPMYNSHYRFRNLNLDGTTVEGNEKGDVLQVYQEDNILYESGDSDCILLETV
jgi:hypothetical protein